MKTLSNILVSVLVFLFSVSISLAKINNPIKENTNLLSFIKKMPLKKVVYFKDDKFTYSYSIFKTKDYITVNKIYIKNIKDYKIDYIKVNNDMYVFNQVVFIYNNNYKLIKSFIISDFDKLFEYISRNSELMNIFKEQYFLLNGTLFKLVPELVETDKNTNFMKIKVFMIENNIEYYLFNIMR